MNKLRIISLCMIGSFLSLFASMAENRVSNRETMSTMSVEITDTVPIDVHSGIAYSHVLSPRVDHLLRMTILVPRTRQPKPAIVYYPGGGFTSSNYDRFIGWRMALAQAGFVVAAVEYRVVPERYPAPIIDAKAAIRYLRAHAAELGIDPTRIGVLGNSAGGYISQMVATTNGEKEFDQGDNLDQSSEVQAAATIYGISNLLNIGEGYSDAIQKIHASPAVAEALLVNGVATKYPGASIFSNPEKALAASPMGHIKENMPPFLIMHGSADRLVSPVQSEQLYKALVEKGNQVDYVVVEKADHGDIYWYQQPIIDKLVNWFKQTLMNKK